MTNEAKALVVVSSVTGNTRVVGHWLADAYAAGVLYTPETAPSDLTGFSTVLLGFWCDKGDAPEDMKAFAARVTGKTIGTFITMGAEPEDPRAQAWAKKVSGEVAALGKNNTLKATFLCRTEVIWSTPPKRWRPFLPDSAHGRPSGKVSRFLPGRPLFRHLP